MQLNKKYVSFKNFPCGLSFIDFKEMYLNEEEKIKGKRVIRDKFFYYDKYGHYTEYMKIEEST